MGGEAGPVTYDAVKLPSVPLISGHDAFHMLGGRLSESTATVRS